MTTAQLNGFRKLHESTIRPEITRTAREMAFISHQLHSSGDRAKVTATEEIWTWDNRRELWCY